MLYFFYFYFLSFYFSALITDNCNICSGLFSLRKKIEDAVLRAEFLAPTALELEEERRIRQEDMIRDYNLWDDPSKSNEILVQLADSAKVVDSLKDLKYKVMCSD